MDTDRAGCVTRGGGGGGGIETSDGEAESIVNANPHRSGSDSTKTLAFRVLGWHDI